MSYRRVLPRDLFNEAKLLKCLGQLALILHDREGRYPLKVEHVRPDVGFAIAQNSADGSIAVVNLHVHVVEGSGWREIAVFTPLNARGPYPLQYDDSVESGQVFSDDGEFADEFLAYIGLES